MSPFFGNPTPILKSDFTYAEATAYVFLCALLLLLCLFILLIRLCSFTSSSNKNTTTPLLASHPDAPVLGVFPGGVAGESSRADVEECGSGCVVCLNSLEEGGAGIKMLPRCGHTFHGGCIARWLVSRPSCPLCRAPTTDGGGAALPEAMGAPGRMRMEAYEQMGDLFVPLTLHSYFM